MCLNTDEIIRKMTVMAGLVCAVNQKKRRLLHYRLRRKMLVEYTAKRL